MAACEMCGNDGYLQTRKVEGIEMKLCKACQKYGEEVAKPKKVLLKKRSFAPKDDKTYEFITSKAGALIKQARERMGMKQIDLSRKLFIKESVIHQVEAGNIKPDFATAKKFEEGLGIKLIVKKEVTETSAAAESSGSGFTIGDLIKKK